MKRATVIGWPVAHSKSPLIHSYWLKRYGIAGAYDKTAVRPENLPDFVQRAWDEGLAGFNATLPHKERLLDLVETDATARAIGAANMCYRGEQAFIGSNTDGEGWWRSLSQTWAAEEAPRTALVLGAGGAARAVVHRLKTLGSVVTVANRSRRRAEALGAQLGAWVIDWPGAEIDGHGYQLIVNASTCGMHGENPLTLARLDPGSLVSDLVYAPITTQLLASAQTLGGRPVDGLAMLLHQAAGGFERWFGLRPEVTDDLRQAVAAA